MAINNQLYKIVLISAGQPSLNPRLVKEADALADAGYQVIVIYAYWNEWGTTYDKLLLATKKWRAIRAGGDPDKKRMTYFLSRLIHKFGIVFHKRMVSNTVLSDLAIARSSYFLIKEAKNHQADLYIGHNLGALPATVKAAKYHKTLCGFDAEDFHRYEITNHLGNYNYIITAQLEDNYFKYLAYLTTSSPQTSAAYAALYPNIKPITLLNAFLKSTAIKKRTINATGPVTLVWFSQTIGPKRGIEDVVKALNAFDSSSFELHLLGQVREEYKQFILNSSIAGKIYFYNPLPSDEVIGFVSQFDIGLASETGFSINNDFALSNKLFTYLQAGLAIVASDTVAQKSFIEANPGIGKVYNKTNNGSLIDVLSAFNSDREMLFDTCEYALKAGQEKFNWENESVKFLELIRQTLNKN